MASGTAHYNLTKPASTEMYDLAVWNENMDNIDAQMYQNETRDVLPDIDFSQLSAQQIADLKTALGIS